MRNYNDYMPTVKQLDELLWSFVDDEKFPYPLFDNYVVDNMANNKLVQDGYCSLSIEKNGAKNYSQTFDGWMFIQNGGYKAFYKHEARKKKIQILKDWLLITGSWIAGVSAVGLCIIELLKHYAWH